MRIRTIATAMALLCVCATATAQNTGLTRSGLDPAAFESEIEGLQSHLYVLRNANGLEACVTNYGARLVSMVTPDRDGNMKDVVLGYRSVADYASSRNELGATVGRFANRIAGGTFTIDGVTYQVAKNNGNNCLHGGANPWYTHMYEGQRLSDSSVKLTLKSPDGDEQFPGNVIAEVTYTLRDDNGLEIAYHVTTDAPTPINMTNHSYFNLSGDMTQTALDQILFIDAPYYTPFNQDQVPTGELRSVKGTALDFTQPKVISQDIGSAEARGGYDHNFSLSGDITKVSASLLSPKTGIRMDVYTDQPGMQFYSGSWVGGRTPGKHGEPYRSRCGVCLETQFYPDAVNHPEWGQPAVLRPGKPFEYKCVYKFSVDK